MKTKTIRNLFIILFVFLVTLLCNVNILNAEQSSKSYTDCKVNLCFVDSNNNPLVGITGNIRIGCTTTVADVVSGADGCQYGFNLVQNTNYCVKYIYNGSTYYYYFTCNSGTCNYVIVP